MNSPAAILRSPPPAAGARETAQPPGLSADCRLGSWRLTQIVHRSAHAALFRARPQEASDGAGCYLVKAPTLRGEAQGIGRAMLAREARVGQSVSHPNLAAVLASHWGGDKPHLVRPYLEGLTLRELLAHLHQPMPIASALWIARQVAEALRTLHQSGWLHGQVRPEHVIVSPQGHATLIDFALSRKLETAECAADAWRAESLVYAPPEALTARGRLTAASDAYCLGLLQFELLTGRLPFDAADPARLAQMHRSQAPLDVRGLRAGAPPELSQFLRLMLAKEPLRRPTGDELVRWLTELEIAALT